jgi:2-methylcitrate dehydratase PrpD
MARVRVEADPECDAIYPYQFPAVVRGRTRDGSSFEERVLVNRGGPDDPLSPDDLAHKFRTNVRARWDADQAEAAILAVERLEAAGGFGAYVQTWSAQP